MDGGVMLSPRSHWRDFGWLMVLLWPRSEIGGDALPIEGDSGEMDGCMLTSSPAVKLEIIHAASLRSSFFAHCRIWFSTAGTPHAITAACEQPVVSGMNGGRV